VSDGLNPEILSCAAWKMLFHPDNSYFHIPKLSVTFHVLDTDVESGTSGVHSTASFANIQVQVTA
jgi:hypothetical protein